LQNWLQYFSPSRGTQTQGGCAHFFDLPVILTLLSHTYSPTIGAPEPNLYPVIAVKTSRLLKNSVATLSLGGAALQRCDKLPVFNRGFSR
jgi:hypothetical protein